MALSPQEGLLLIPDISGYTEFLHTVEIAHSQHIIAELLEGLIEGNEMDLHLSEVEGDALLFFRPGPPPSFSAIQTQVERWFSGFHTRLKSLKTDVLCGCGACQDVGNLSLKVVGHFGEMGTISVGGREKIFGTNVVLAHRMLKNSLPLRNYLLLTTSLFELLEKEGLEGGRFDWHEEEYPVFGRVPLGFLDMGPFVAGLPPPTPRETMPQLPGGFSVEETIRTPISAVESHVTDLDKWVLWNEGLKEMVFDRSKPYRRGHKHQCIVVGGVLHQTLEQLMVRSKEFTMVVRVKPPVLLVTDLWIGYFAEEKDGVVSVRGRMEFAGNPLGRWLLNRLMAPKLRGRMTGSLKRLKTLLEGQAETSLLSA